MDYTSLTGNKTVEGSIRQWVNNDAVPAGEVLGDAENWIEQMLRVMGMQKRFAFTLEIGQSELDLSTDVPDYLDPIQLWNVRDEGPLQFVTEFDIDRYRSVDRFGVLTKAAPESFTTIGRDLMVFDAQADAAYPMVLTYYGRPTPLSPDNQTNLYTKNYRVLLRYACMGMAYIFMKDEGRADGLLKLAAGICQQIAVSDDDARRGQRYDTEY